MDGYHVYGKGVEMKKSELTAMTVVELKALAKKRNVSLSAGDKKADIIKALVAVSTTDETRKKAGCCLLKTGGQEE